MLHLVNMLHIYTATFEMVEVATAAFEDVESFCGRKWVVHIV
jgi:hypothetical protein